MQVSDRDTDRRLQAHAEQARALGYEDTEVDWSAAWALLGVMVVGKVLIMLALVMMMPSPRMLVFLAAYNWSWIVLTLVLVGGPVAFWWRLWRMRRKRAALLHAEWHVE